VVAAPAALAAGLAYFTPAPGNGQLWTY